MRVRCVVFVELFVVSVVVLWLSLVCVCCSGMYRFKCQYMCAYGFDSVCNNDSVCVPAMCWFVVICDVVGCWCLFRFVLRCVIDWDCCSVYFCFVVVRCFWFGVCCCACGLCCFVWCVVLRCV